MDFYIILVVLSSYLGGIHVEVELTFPIYLIGYRLSSYLGWFWEQLFYTGKQLVFVPVVLDNRTLAGFLTEPIRVAI